ncbi:MAG: hypothetical protein IKX75_00155, partial [Desulfovibrio sp.]|nr:hypothetical protein [Desulfovibrio sp.]
MKNPRESNPLGRALLPSLLAALALLAAGCHKKAERIGCLNNLKMVGLALAMYADDNEDYFPRNLEKLVADGYLDSENPQCPACGKEYRYLGDSGINADELANADKCVFVYCEFEHEKG